MPFTFGWDFSPRVLQALLDRAANASKLLDDQRFDQAWSRAFRYAVRHEDSIPDDEWSKILRWLTVMRITRVAVYKHPEDLVMLAVRVEEQVGMEMAKGVSPSAALVQAQAFFRRAGRDPKSTPRERYEASLVAELVLRPMQRKK